VGVLCSDAAADTLEWALVQAYQNNPSLNSQRAALRVIDENVPQALSGYRPKISLTAVSGYNYENATQQLPIGGALTTTTYASQFLSRTVGLTGTQTLFNGFQTANRTRQAESQVDAARETLRVTEQQVLLDAATAYMNLLRDGAILELNQSNVQVLTEQLKQTRDRFNVGEVTRTDVAQAESRLAAGRSALLGAQSNFVTSQANYRRVIGVNPGKLAAGTPVDRLSPNALPRAITQGQTLSPSVLAAWSEDKRGRALPEFVDHGRRLVRGRSCLRTNARNPGVRSRPVDRADLPGGRGIFHHPAKQGNAGPAAAVARHQS